jgi:hypothetical protein
LGVNTGGVNAAGVTYVAYLFAPIPGFSANDFYYANDAVNGPFLYCGFRPRWVMVKSVGNAYPWLIFDSARDTINPCQLYFMADVANAETGSGTPRLDFLSNGFKLRTPAGNGPNYPTGATHIVLAFAEYPFKYARAS